MNIYNRYCCSAFKTKAQIVFLSKWRLFWNSVADLHTNLLCSRIIALKDNTFILLDYYVDFNLIYCYWFSNWCINLLNVAIAPFVDNLARLFLRCIQPILIIFFVELRWFVIKESCGNNEESRIYIMNIDF